jgi:inosine-uridine nucleoside N-ribohydrolase
MSPFLLGCYLLLTSLPQSAGISVIVDTDAGSDDLMAIAFLLARPDVQLEAVTVVHGLAHVPQGAENVRKLLALAGRTDIPVYLGREEPIRRTAEFPAAWRKTADELLAALPAAKALQSKLDAVSFYRKARRPDSIVVALGPLTNLAAAVQSGVRFSNILMMGGAVRVRGNLGDGGYFKTDNTTAEWNVFCDPAAADVVFRSGAGIRMVPLDATNEVPLRPEFVQKLRGTARSALGKAVAGLLEREREVISQGLYYAWDPLAAVSLVAPKAVRWEPLRIRIRPDGTTEEAANGGAPVQVALHADAASFHDVYLAALR